MRCLTLAWLTTTTSLRPTVVVVGGGASGYFAGIAAKRARKDVDVVILEQQGSGLKKVLISGGGRCNVMHDEEAFSTDQYPRGRKELRGPFSRFGPAEARAFFEGEGVALKVEDDGRVFPTTDDSQTIANALKEAAKEAGVEVIFGDGVVDIDARFRLATKKGLFYDADAVVLATGSAPQGYLMAKKLGHDVISPYPSLFSFRVKDFKDLAGVSVNASLAFGKFKQEGALLFTHRGISGPCALKLSAFAARDLADAKYKGSLLLNTLPHLDRDAVLETLRNYKKDHPTQLVVSPKKRPFPDDIPKRLWAALMATVVSSPTTTKWNDVDLTTLVDGLTRRSLPFSGRDANKDEFVTAGGVNLREVDMRTMQSKIVPGLHFAGELLDVDAVTGGFNFQACWTSGFLAGSSAADVALARSSSEDRRH